MKGAVSTRLARKQAFVEISNLMASFQRMIQEPKSKQNKLPQVYKLTFLITHCFHRLRPSELTYSLTKLLKLLKHLML
jgi:hypothetical protein